MSPNQHIISNFIGIVFAAIAQGADAHCAAIIGIMRHRIIPDIQRDLRFILQLSIFRIFCFTNIGYTRKECVDHHDPV